MTTQTWTKLHTQTMNQQWTPAVYEQPCQVLTWSKPHHCTFCCLSLTACLVTRDRQTHTIDLSESKFPYCLTCCQRIQMELSSLLLSSIPTLQAGTSLSLLFSRILLKYIVGVAFNHEMFECEIHGKWSNLQPNIHTHVQCCHASVGLAQAHINNILQYTQTLFRIACTSPSLIQCGNSCLLVTKFGL